MPLFLVLEILWRFSFLIEHENRSNKKEAIFLLSNNKWINGFIFHIMPLFKIIPSAHLVYGLVDIFVLIKLRECYIVIPCTHFWLEQNISETNWRRTHMTLNNIEKRLKKSQQNWEEIKSIENSIVLRAAKAA